MQKICETFLLVDGAGAKKKWKYMQINGKILSVENIFSRCACCAFLPTYKTGLANDTTHSVQLPKMHTALNARFFLKLFVVWVYFRCMGKKLPKNRQKDW